MGGVDKFVSVWYELKERERERFLPGRAGRLVPARCEMADVDTLSPGSGSIRSFIPSCIIFLHLVTSSYEFYSVSLTKSESGAG